MKRYIVFALLLCVTFTALAVDLNRDGRDSAYVETILKRSQKIVDKLDIRDSEVSKQVLHIIANRYFLLNDIYEVRDQKVKDAKAKLSGDAKQAAITAAENEKDAKLYRHHFEFAADLSLYLSPEKVDEVKDGMTYNSLKVQYESLCDMIPSLTEEEKAQVYAWYKEAREFAMDAENSNKKHGFFNKYKGRINNYLAKRGYDLVKERNAWYERLKAQGKKF